MISIVIPTFNEEKIIETTLKKLRSGLERTKYELIVSDDNSTDKTAAIAKKYADNVVTSKDANRTIGKGRNRGAAAARGEYLVFIDADVSIPNADDFFTNALSLFEKDARLTGLTVSLRVLPEHATFADNFFFGGLNLFHYVSNNFFHAGRAPGEFQMIRAEVFKKLGGYRSNLAASEDYEMFWRLSRAGNTRMEKKLFVYHTGRRPHKIGWPKLLLEWFLNATSVALFKRSASKEWTPIR